MHGDLNFREKSEERVSRFCNDVTVARGIQLRTDWDFKDNLTRLSSGDD